MAKRFLEVCVDGPQGVDACAMTAVDRIELCAALDVGGLDRHRRALLRADHAPMRLSGRAHADDEPRRPIGGR